MLAIDGVVAVQADELDQPLTDSSPTFIGADRRLRRSSAAQPNAGKGVIFGVLDTGVWPEHPSFADHGNLGAPPAKADGTPRACDFGDNPLTPADRRVRLQQQAHRRRSRSSTPTTPIRPAARSYPTPPATRNGHGTHTATTAAGNVARLGADLRRRARPDQRHRPGRLGHRSTRSAASQGCFGSDSAAAVAAGDPRRRRRHQLLDLAAAPTRSPTRSSWPSSTPTPPACSSPPRPATTARAPAPPTTCRRGSTTVGRLDPDRASSSRR